MLGFSMIVVCLTTITVHHDNHINIYDGSHASIISLLVILIGANLKGIVDEHRELKAPKALKKTHKKH